MLKKIVFAAIFIVILKEPSLACSCRGGVEIDEKFNSADVVFIGKCILSELIEERGSVRNTFIIQSIWKGASNNKSIITETNVDSDSCGFYFKPGFSYIVFGYIKDGITHTGQCLGNRTVGYYPERIDPRAQDEIKTLNEISETIKQQTPNQH